MGILNITPDSFSDGGAFFNTEAAVRRARQMEEEGADMIDIGAQSTRPGATPLSETEERARLVPVLKALEGTLSVPVSVDTFFPSVADAALSHGASILNDVTGFRNPAMVRLVSQSDCGCIFMHPGGVKNRADLVNEVHRDLEETFFLLNNAGIPENRLCADAGIGFGKTPQECLTLIRETARVRLSACAYLVGASRKRFIGEATGEENPQNRLAGTVAADTAAQLFGADILRVHDVAAAVQAARLTDALKG